MTSIYTSNGEEYTSTSSSTTVSSTAIDQNNNSGLSTHNKVIIGCVVGIVTPVLIGAGLFAAWWYKRKNQTLDHSGQEWHDEEEEEAGVFDEGEATVVPRSQSVNKAVNF